MAGSSVAIRLAQQGRKVLMVDRDTFPSDTLSTHGLNFIAVESLNRLGVLQRIEAAGFQRMYRHRAWLDDICIEVPAGPVGAYSLAPRRNVLDQILIDRAVECGAEFIERARVERVIVESGSVVGAVVQRIGGERFEVRAKVVVGADGKNSNVAKWVAAEKYEERPFGRPIYYAYCHGLEPLPEPTMELFFGSNRVGFCLAMRPDEHCLIIESQPGEFESIRRDPRAWLLREYATLPGMARRLKNVVFEEHVFGTRGVESNFRKPYGPGWALTGDASYVKDPITGLGVGDALLQGFLLAKALGAWFDGADWEVTMSGFQQRRDLAFRPFFDQTEAAVAARDDGDALDDLRAALVSQHDAHLLLKALPGLLDQAFAPMDRFRHAVLKSMFDSAKQTGVQIFSNESTGTTQTVAPPT